MRRARQVARGTRFDDHANAASGWRASVRATNPCIPGGRAASASRAAVSDSNGANTQPPDPVIRAERRALRQRCQRRSDLGKACRRYGLQVVPAITLGKDVHFRRRRVSCQFRAAEDFDGPHRDGRNDDRDPEGRQRDGATRSPTPCANAGSPKTKNGTSAPSRTPMRISFAREADSSRHRRLSASSTEAASELPPPKPTATRDALDHRNIGAAAAAGRLFAARAPHEAIDPSSATMPGRSAVRRIAPSSRNESVIVSPNRARRKESRACGNRRAAAGHVQEQVELRRRRNGQHAHPAIVAARGARRQRARDCRPWRHATAHRLQQLRGWAPASIGPDHTPRAVRSPHCQDVRTAALAVPEHASRWLSPLLPRSITMRISRSGIRQPQPVRHSLRVVAIVVDDLPAILTQHACDGRRHRARSSNGAPSCGAPRIHAASPATGSAKAQRALGQRRPVGSLVAASVGGAHFDALRDRIAADLRDVLPERRRDDKVVARRRVVPREIRGDRFATLDARKVGPRS